ncbi:hypothetical protein H5410_001051 [Solanum commersonii]|uniref:DUF7745 domain-containing protein n=1 Tax=Solanum commersonii TaxID=4109 RepID=A0A9J6AXU5_SOLCO|nr:hypothetical protein H5410_001051 [Solanum commersonii]
MQINQNLHNIRMMTEVPRTLKEWWKNIRVAYGNEIMPHLGSLVDLLNMEANKSLITLMIEFCQPARVTFQFTDFEITQTLEEISQIVNLPLAGRAPLAPCTTSRIDFLQSLGLRNPDRKDRCFGARWCGILDSDMGVESWCTPEYYTWFMMGEILARPSYEGILGFIDTQRSNQIVMELLNLMHITTTMYQ